MKVTPLSVLFLLFVVVVLSLQFHDGFTVFDQGDYLKCASELASGKIDVQKNFAANRIGACLPYAIGIKLLGFGKWLTLITTLEFTALLVMVYWLVMQFSQSVALISIVLLGLSPILLEQSGDISADVLTTLSANAPLLIYFWMCTWSKNGIQKSAKFWGMVSGCFFVLSVLTKESCIFFVPVMFYFAIKDREDSEARKFWLSMFAVIAGCGVITLACYGYFTDDIFYRIHAVESGPSAGMGNYAASTFYEVLKRLTIHPISFLIEDYGFGVLVLFSCIHFAIPHAGSASRFLKVYLLGTLGMWWFGSQSFGHWNPVALAHRIWLPLLVPLALNAAVALHSIFTDSLSPATKRRFITIVLIFLVYAWVSLYQSHIEYTAMGFPQSFLSIALKYTLICGLILMAIYRYETKFAAAQKFLFIAILMLLFTFRIFLDFALWAEGKSMHMHDYDNERKAIEYTEKLNPTLVITDLPLSRNYGIYNGFTGKIPFVAYTDINGDSIKDGTLLLINRQRILDFQTKIVETGTYVKIDYTIPEYITHPEAFDFRLLRETPSHQWFIKL